MGIDTVAVTGGNGFIGEAILDDLRDHGYRTVNLARGKRREDVSHRYIRTDLLAAGNVYGSLATAEADAIVHMGTLGSPKSNPGYEVYESNAMSTYHVLEAAEELGLEAVSIASSINAHGWSFQEEPPEIEYLPIDEEHPVSPRDPYGLGKRVAEVTAEGVARRNSSPDRIATLRISSAHSDEDLQTMADDDRTLADLREQYDPGDNPTFRYIHVRDVARLAVRTIEPDAGYTGHETFWAVASDTRVDVPTEDLLEAFYPETEVRTELSGSDGLFDLSKARDLVGWEPERSWRRL